MKPSLGMLIVIFATLAFYGEFNFAGDAGILGVKKDSNGKRFLLT